MLERRGEILRRLLKAVDEYYETFRKPIPMKAVSARFARSLEAAGGFGEGIDELHQDGSIDVVMTPAGGRLIYPGGQALILPDGKHVLLKR